MEPNSLHVYLPNFSGHQEYITSNSDTPLARLLPNGNSDMGYLGLNLLLGEAYIEFISMKNNLNEPEKDALYEAVSDNNGFYKLDILWYLAENGSFSLEVKPQQVELEDVLDNIETENLFFIEANHRLLNYAEERACGLLGSLGHKEYLNKLTTHNIRLALSNAKSYINRGTPFSDLFGSANLGLIIAAGKFNYMSTNRFSTYATYWIRAYLEKEVRKNETGISREDLSRISKYNHFVEDFVQKYDRLPEKEEKIALLQRLGLPNPKKQLIHIEGAQKNLRPASLDELQELRKTVPDKTNNYLEIERLQDIKSLAKAFETLTEKEKRLLMLHYGFEGEPLSFEEITKIMGTTRQNLSVLEKKAREKLRKIMVPYAGHIAQSL
jgi:RNA polymerase sigma factor (sigma-70 family)